MLLQQRNGLGMKGQNVAWKSTMASLAMLSTILKIQ